MWKSRARSARRRYSFRGFTLIEILIAFSILVVCMAVLFQSFSSSLDAVGRTERATSAILLARSTMERVGMDIPLIAGAQVGRSGDGADWSVVIAPAPPELAPPVSGLPVRLFQVEVKVTAPKAAPVTLSTLRLAPVFADGASP